MSFQMPDKLAAFKEKKKKNKKNLQPEVDQNLVFALEETT